MLLLETNKPAARTFTAPRPCDSCGDNFTNFIEIDGELFCYDCTNEPLSAYNETDDETTEHPSLPSPTARFAASVVITGMIGLIMFSFGYFVGVAHAASHIAEALKQ